MTSVSRINSQIPRNALYTNIRSANSSIFQADGLSVAPWMRADLTTAAGWSYLGALSSPGGITLRDMGKSAYVPDPTVPATVGCQSTILRKVQLITGFYGTGTSVGTGSAGAPSGTTGEYLTGYIKLGGQTYGGAEAGTAAAVSVFVRAN
jgi:hypothetical protein